MALRTAPTVSLVKLDVPTDHVLLLTLNRPKSLNAVSAIELSRWLVLSLRVLEVSPDLAEDVKRVLAWFDNEPELWYAFRLD
jgi:enoyl-CoA hydratase/carnithine racemase